MTFIISRQWIHDNKTPGGSWNARQLRCLGISWQPNKGWLKRVVGMSISIELKERFEKLATKSTHIYKAH